ncbi:hypothetical protein LguiB_028627 [Lonicera macranthoides]
MVPEEGGRRERVLHFGKAICRKPFPGGSPATAQPRVCQYKNWGGDGGGQGRYDQHELRPWATDFAILASLLVKLSKGEWSETKRLSDVSVFKGVTTICRVINFTVSAKENLPTDSVLLDDRVGDLSITVKCGVDDGSSKLEVKNTGNGSSRTSAKIQINRVIALPLRREEEKLCCNSDKNNSISETLL